MKVEVTYPIVRTIEIEIPDELADEYKDAHTEDDYNKIDLTVDKIDDYVRDTLPQIDANVEFLDWFDWEVVD